MNQEANRVGSARKRRRSRQVRTTSTISVSGKPSTTIIASATVSTPDGRGACYVLGPPPRIRRSQRPALLCNHGVRDRVYTRMQSPHRCGILAAPRSTVPGWTGIRVGLLMRTMWHSYSRLGAGLILTLSLCFATISTARATGQSHFTSYQITTVTSYDSQPDQNLPASAVTTIGGHTVIERMIVRDSTHYRVEVQTLAPAIDSGTLTVTMSGNRMVAYDSRTGRAVWDTASGAGAPQPSNIQMALQISPLAPLPDPGQSFRQYLAALRGPGSAVHSSVRIVGHTRMLGHPVTILDYGPLVGTGRPICVRPSRHSPHPVCHSSSGSGRGRLWVATDHPAILKYTEGHFSGLPGGMMRRHYLYRVTSLRFGPVPIAITRFTPPVPLEHSKWLSIAVVGGGDAGWFAGWPAVWRTGILYRAPPPIDSHGNRYTMNSVYIHRDSLVPIPSTMGVLYYRPAPSILPGVPPPQYGGSGPYVYLQERIQVHGLPAALRHGRHMQRGRCSLWTGSYRKGLPWMALQRQRVSLVASTNALSQRDLIRYGFASLCG